MCNHWGCYLFPHIITVHGSVQVQNEVIDWLSEKGCVEANQYGKGDFLYTMLDEQSFIRGYEVTYAFKDASHATLFKFGKP